jgi:hypothetical protein
MTTDWLELVSSVVGLSYAKPTREAYLDLIAPIEKEPLRSEMGKMSGCALVARGLLRRYGWTDNEIMRCYRPGRAVADVVQMARTHLIWRHEDTMPQAGDIVLVGGPGNGGCEHVFTVTAVDPDGKMIQSVDGGQVDVGGWECIKLMSRPYQVYPSGRIKIGSRFMAGLVRMLP